MRVQVGLVCGSSALGVLRKHRSGTQVGLANAGLVLFEPHPRRPGMTYTRLNSADLG